MGISISYGEAMCLLCALIWAFNGLVLRTQSFKVPPALMNAVRCGIAALFFWTLLPFGAPLSDYGQVLPHEWALLLGAVLVGVVTGDTLYLVAIREMGVSRTMALVGTFPLTTLLFEWLLLQRPVNRAFVMGCCLVVSGVICLSSRSRQEQAGQNAQPGRLVYGVFLALTAAFLWGLSTVMLKPAIAHLTPVQANSIRMPLVALVLFVVWSWGQREGGIRQMDRRALAIVAGTGVLGMGVGSLLFLEAIQLVGPAKTATLSSASPVFGMVMAVIFLKETMTLRLALGVLLCVAGVWLVL